MIYYNAEHISFVWVKYQFWIKKSKEIYEEEDFRASTSLSRHTLD